LRIEELKHSNLKTGAPMSQKPISPLRQRMLEDMSLRGFTPDTQRDYIRAVEKLASFLGRSPDTATAEDLRVPAAVSRVPASLIITLMGAQATESGSQRLTAGGRWIRTCMGLFLSSSRFWFLPVLCSERESRSSSRRLGPGSRSARKGSRDRNGSKAWRLAA
jgi:hypothetical protein